jgi:hypothetical protein
MALVSCLEQFFKISQEIRGKGIILQGQHSYVISSSEWHG